MALTKVQNTGIADDAVTTDKIENSTVLAADLAASSVTNAKIATGTIGNDKLTNSSVTINGSSLSLGGSATLKHIDWQAVTVADGSTTLTATAGKGYFLDTNTGVIEVFLPTSPTRGDTIVLADYSGTFSTNQIIINTGGNLIDSTQGPDFKVTTNNSIVELVYVDSNKGWLVKLNQAAGSTPDAIVTGTYDVSFTEATGGTVTTSGDYKIHSFTGDGCFVVSSAGNAEGGKASYVVVAGGGAGGGNDHGGGGGAGGYREGKTPADPFSASPKNAGDGLSISAQTYPITVGAGGSAGSAPTGFRGNDGSNSVFSTITSAGGGGGGSNHPQGPGAVARNGKDGGSGGGGAGISGQPNGTGGTGNTPPVSPTQGNDGGDSNYSGGSPNGYPTGGGGGATAAGGDGSGNNSGDGGAGATSSITGSGVARAGGGGGSSYPSGNNGDGGAGGGGAGRTNATVVPGTANTGGGGGGLSQACSTAGGLGGKGIVIIRYKFQ